LEEEIVSSMNNVNNNNKKDMINNDIKITDNQTLEKAASSIGLFLKTKEVWLLSLIDSSYGKSEDEIVKEAVRKYKSALTANIEHHQNMVQLFLGSDPSRAREHRILSKIYKAFNKGE